MKLANATNPQTSDELQVNKAWAKLPLFDRSKWRRVRFGDVVENLNETERNPAAAGIERFIAMEHLEPGSLRIREWGDVAEGTTFNRRCRPGQVLFGKRRAYQRKVAVAEFDAVVSGDIYVFAPKGDRLLPELLPFLCISERFFNFAVETSAGSLSPRTNWSSLASFEFDLPPLAQQRRIAEILRAMDDALDAYDCEIEAAEKAKDCLILKRLESMAHNECDVVSLADVCERIVDGTHFTPTYITSGIPFLRVTDIQEDGIDWDKVRRISPLEHQQLCNRCNPRKGDVLLSKNGTIGISKVVDWDEEFSIFVSLCLLRPKELLLTEYLAEALNSKYVQDQFLKRSKQGTVTNLHLIEIRECRLPMPSKAAQRDLVQASSRFSALILSSRKRRDMMISLRRAMLETVLK